MPTRIYNQHDMYVHRKIEHLRRTGLVTGTKSGRGMNGGACPDWLADVQRDEAKRILAKTQRQ